MAKNLIEKLLSLLQKVYTNQLKSKKMVFLLTPPDSVRGMTTLCREKFTKKVDVPCLYLGKEINNKVMPVMKKYLLKLRKHKPLIRNDDGIFMAQLDPEKVETMDDISESDCQIIREFTTDLNKMSVEINYHNWSVDKILRAVLPEEVEIPTSFTKVGHILHFNLRENQLPYKHLIGQVYLDFIPDAKTIVNKLSNIETKFRFFEMEIIAGEENTVTMVKENKCEFTFDFAKVYWNSRLCTEHENLLKFMNKGDVLYDVFAGVGPFAIPAAKKKKGVHVLANDLNPESFKWLKFNAETNKTENIMCFNKDGRDFIRNEVKNHLLKRRNENKSGKEHIAMNLPAIAPDFLNTFCDWMNEDEIKKVCKNPPLVHLYCFVKIGKNEDPRPVAKKMVEDSLGGIDFDEKELEEIHHVRNVAPSKEMMRVSFYLSERINLFIKSEEPIVKMGKNKKGSNKTKNVFKVQTKKNKSKVLNKNKKLSTKKKDLNNFKRKSTDKIQAIDQQLIKVRHEANSGTQPKPSKIMTSLKSDKLEKKTQASYVMNNDVIDKLKNI